MTARRVVRWAARSVGRLVAYGVVGAVVVETTTTTVRGILHRGEDGGPET